MIEKTFINRGKKIKRIYFSDYIVVKKEKGSFIIDKDKESLLDKSEWSIITKNKNNPYKKYVISYKLGSIHRFIVKAKKGDIVDHINGNTMDNRLLNLRIVNSSQNSMNRKAQRRKKYSNYKGVFLRKDRWICLIRVNGKLIYKKCNSEIMAAKKYNEFALQYHGEFARLNDI